MSTLADTKTQNHTNTHTHRLRGLGVTGITGTLAAMVATTVAAALASAIGVDFEVYHGADTIPISGITTVTGLFSVVGVLMAVAFRRWSARPAERFVRTAVVLTAISLVPPAIAGANIGTVVALMALHLVCAAVMIPTLTRSFRN